MHQKSSFYKIGNESYKSPKDHLSIGDCYGKYFKYYKYVSTIPESKYGDNSTDASSDGNKYKRANKILDDKNNVCVKKISQNSRLKNFPLLSKWETTGSVYYPRNGGNNNGFKEIIHHNIDYFKEAMEHIANAYKCS